MLRKALGLPASRQCDDSQLTLRTGCIIAFPALVHLSGEWPVRLEFLRGRPAIFDAPHGRALIPFCVNGQWVFARADVLRGSGETEKAVKVRFYCLPETARYHAVLEHLVRNTFSGGEDLTFNTRRGPFVASHLDGSLAAFIAWALHLFVPAIATMSAQSIKKV
jgi:hypothetical protein